MRGRKPAKIGALVQAHNLFMTLLSLWMVAETVQQVRWPLVKPQASFATAREPEAGSCGGAQSWRTFGWGRPGGHLWGNLAEQGEFSDSGRRLAVVIWVHYLSKVGAHAGPLSQDRHFLPAGRTLCMSSSLCACQCLVAKQTGQHAIVMRVHSKHVPVCEHAMRLLATAPPASSGPQRHVLRSVSAEAPPARRPGSSPHMRGQAHGFVNTAIMALRKRKHRVRVRVGTERAAARRRTSLWTRPSWWRARTTGRSRCCTCTTTRPPSSPAGGPPSASRPAAMSGSSARSTRPCTSPCAPPPPAAPGPRRPGACSASSGASATTATWSATRQGQAAVALWLRHEGSVAPGTAGRATHAAPCRLRLRTRA